MRRRLALVLCATITVVTGSPATAATDIRGTGSSDGLVGTASSDVMEALSGDDVVRGLAGRDDLRGGHGDDRLIGGAGGDTLDGGRGDDLVVGGRGSDAPSDGRGRDVVRAGAGNDLIVAVGDGQPDDFHCGPGRDLVATYGFEPDEVDEFHGCERFDSSCRVTARATSQGRVICSIPRHISSVVPSPHTT